MSIEPTGSLGCSRRVEEKIEMLDSVFALFSNDLAIDLGKVRAKVARKNRASVKPPPVEL